MISQSLLASIKSKWRINCLMFIIVQKMWCWMVSVVYKDLEIYWCINFYIYLFCWFICSQLGIITIRILHKINTFLTWRLLISLTISLPCRYLSALISQSFLDIGSVSRILDSIMKLCLQFCWSIENQESYSSASEVEHITEVPSIFVLYAPLTA